MVEKKMVRNEILSDMRGKASNEKKIKKSGIAYSGSAYNRLGMTKGMIASWEDGRRSGQGEGEYEWWYFDSHLDDGSSLVIAFYTKNVKSNALKEGDAPRATAEYDTPDGKHFEDQVEVEVSNFSADTDRCNIKLGSSYFRGDLHDYEIYFHGNRIKAEIKLHGNVPPWRPGTGHIFFGNQDEKFFAWLPAVPEGTVTANIVVEEKAECKTGTGYHDHNWGNVPMDILINHWYWGRAKIGPFQVVSSYITGEKEYGYQAYPIFMIARDGEILADDAPHCLQFRTEQRYYDHVTRKPVDQILEYAYKDGDREYIVRYKKESDLVQEQMINLIPNKLMKFLAKISGFDGSYQRFTGEASIVCRQNGKVTESYNSPAIWEMMYFGKTPKMEKIFVQTR